LGASLAQNHTLFFWVAFYDGPLANPTSLPILKSLPSVVAEILKVNTKFGKLPQPRATPNFSSGCNFMMALGKPKVHTKFEVAIFSRCRNIKGNPKILGSFPSPGLRPFFPLGIILIFALANPSCKPNLKSLSLAVAEILKGNPNILESLPGPGPRPQFIWV